MLPYVDKTNRLQSQTLHLIVMPNELQITPAVREFILPLSMPTPVQLKHDAHALHCVVKGRKTMRTKILQEFLFH